MSNASDFLCRRILGIAISYIALVIVMVTETVAGEPLELSVHVNSETVHIMKYDFIGKTTREMGDHCSSFVLENIRKFEFPREIKRYRNAVIDVCNAAATTQSLVFDISEYFQHGGPKRNDMTTIFDKYPTGAN